VAPHRSPVVERLFPGDSEMARRMRALDWANETDLGSPARWPESLRTAVSICLTSRFPIVLWWGPNLTLLYNDAYIPLLGPGKHPQSLGRPGREAWAEIWDTIGPMLEGVMQSAVATWSENLLLFLHRRLAREECYFTFSYSPILAGDVSSVGGIFCAVTETTEYVVGGRRLATLRELGRRTAKVTTAEAACEQAAEVLRENPYDVPFAALYLIDDYHRAHRAGAVRIGADADSFPEVADLEDEAASPWPLRAAWEERRQMDLPLHGDLSDGAWPEPASRAVVLPVVAPGLDALGGVLIVGISPRLVLDEAYRGFLLSVAAQIGVAVADAHAYEVERCRAEALAELDRAKTAFFSNVSHEFRTPLTLLLGPLEDALASEALPPEQRTALDVAHRNSLRLLKLVNTLLDFSRIEAGRVDATFEQTDVSAYTAELASVFRSAVERAGLSLSVRCTPVQAPVFVDREMWEKIVLNLLSNAFKFTLQGGISVGTAERDGVVELTVRDTGTGIPAEELPHVFERFHRVRGSQGRTHEGTGIGLALVSELVKLHGGTVTAQSAVGHGSTFTVTIPTGSAHIAPERIGAKRMLASTALGAGAYIEEAIRWLPDGLDRPAASPRVESLTAVSTAGARVLVADDNVDMRDYVARLLRQYWDVEAVADGAAALEAIRRSPPDLVLTDVMMPRLDGIGLLRAIREDADLRALPVILLSARAGEESRVEGLEVGADDYLVKPFSARELLARVNAHLEMARVRREASADRERATEVLRREEARFRTLVEATAGIVWHADVSGGVTESPGLGAFTGQARAEYLGWGWLEAIHPDDREQVATVWQRALLDKVPVEAEHRMRRHDGAFRSMLVHAVPLLSPDGEVEEWIGTVSDITERRQAEERLGQTVEALQEADERKDEFLAMLAHELRNPLAATQNATRLLALLGVDEPRFVQARAIIDRQTSHLGRLVDDLLDVSRITRGKIALQREPLSLQAVVGAAVELARPAVDRLAHVLTVSHAQETIRLEGDFARLVQVVSNLLTNAAKFTPAGGRITLTTQQTGDRATLRVRDSGVGIARELQAKIFDLFVQGEGGLARTQGGLGIGLTLVKRIVELHDGSIEVRSDGLGRGSEFVMTFPALPASAAVPRGPATARLAGGSRPLRILLVEDNPDAAESFTMLLELGGHEVRAADEAAEALRVVDDFTPDIAFVDVGLPGIDGYELATRLRAHPSCHQSVLVALTGYGRDEDKRRASEAGFDHHLTKPVDFDAVDRVLANVSAAAGVADQRPSMQ
jgi:PAS domain S-box-containing protein